MEQRNEELEDSLEEIRGFDDNSENVYGECKFRDEGEDDPEYGLIGFKRVGQNFAAVEVKCSIQGNEESVPEYKMFQKYMAKLEKDYGDDDDSIELDIDEEVIMSGLDTMVHPLDDSFDAMEILDICDTGPDPIAAVLEQRGIVLPQVVIEIPKTSDKAPEPEALLGEIEQNAMVNPQDAIEIPKKSGKVLKPKSLPVRIKRQKALAHPQGTIEIRKKSDKAPEPKALRGKIKQEDMAYPQDAIEIPKKLDKAPQPKSLLENIRRKDMAYPQDAVEIPKTSDKAPEPKALLGKLKKKDLAHPQDAGEIPKKSEKAQEPKTLPEKPLKEPEVKTTRVKKQKKKCTAGCCETKN